MIVVQILDENRKILSHPEYSLYFTELIYKKPPILIYQEQGNITVLITTGLNLNAG